MRLNDPYARFQLCAVDWMTLNEMLPPHALLSYTWVEALPAELAALLDPFPFVRNLLAERNLRENRLLIRRVYTAHHLDAARLRETLAGLAGWRETAPDHWESELAVCLVRSRTEPNAHLIIDAAAAFARWSSTHPSEEFYGWLAAKRPTRTIC